jgi:putative proteasome-type protease
MTYCVGLRVAEGLVLLADTRTNAGMDNVSRFTKMVTFEKTGERVIALLTAGNLSITQGVIARLKHGIQKGDRDPAFRSIMNVESMFEVAEIVGAEMRRMQEIHREAILEQGTGADATILVAGQRRGGKHRLFLIYSAGNFIQATDDTPYFQLGEHKYGKPILDRVIGPNSSLEESMKAVCVSMDSTIRSNLSVGMPLDLAVIEKDALTFRIHRRIERTDARFSAISDSWAKALSQGFQELPNLLEPEGP